MVGTSDQWLVVMRVERKVVPMVDVWDKTKVVLTVLLMVVRMAELREENLVAKMVKLMAALTVDS